MNTPKAPLEASGTSGMKAAINGIPNFSVLDGWWSEGIMNEELRINSEGSRKKTEASNAMNETSLPSPTTNSSFFIHNCNGWGFEGATEGSQEEQDRSDAAQMYDRLEREIVPLFYDKSIDGIPRQWLAVAKESIATILPHFSGERMMRDYVETMYRPAATKA